MRTSAAFTLFALAGMLAGCNQNKNHTMNDDRSDTTRTATYRSGDLPDFGGYDDRGGSLSSPTTVTAWEDGSANRGYDDREVSTTAATYRTAERDNFAPGASTYDDRSATGGSSTATPKDDPKGDWGYATVATTPDSRILSILHAKNQEEIKLGRLAQQNGQSQDVKDYGEMLVRDHSANDTRVLQTARNAGITLMSEDETKRLCAREKGEAQPPKDCIADLQNKHGAEFDAAFSQKMEKGHQEAIAMIRDARPHVQDMRVRALLDETLPKLQEHEDHAQRLAGVHEHDDR